MNILWFHIDLCCWAVLLTIISNVYLYSIFIWYYSNSWWSMEIDVMFWRYNILYFSPTPKIILYNHIFTEILITIFLNKLQNWLLTPFICHFESRNKHLFLVMPFTRDTSHCKKRFCVQQLDNISHLLKPPLK